MVNIQRGSLITDVMGVKVASVEELTAELLKHDLTQGVRITIVDGKNRRFEVLELPKK